MQVVSDAVMIGTGAERDKFEGQQNDGIDKLLSRHTKLIPDDPISLPNNVFAPQLSTSLRDRQIENGLRYTMFTKQYRMTAGLEVL